MKKITLFLLVFLSLQMVAQNFTKKDLKASPFIDGTLLLPENVENPPLVIIIGGSGAIDRDGNQMMMKNNSLKYLAEGLTKQGIATFRYDKRIVKQMKERNVDEKNMRFDDFVKDANDVYNFFKGSFNNIYFIGHSQGSLVGMIAANSGAKGFISIAGAGQEIDDVIVDQLEKQAPGLKENARKSFDDLRVNGIAVNYSPGLASIFRQDIQPFILNWMQYNPQQEIAKLDIPVLIVNGDKDLQVLTSEAEKLKEAKPDADLLIVQNMNHVMKLVEGDDLENSKTYNDPSLPVAEELIDSIAEFIKK